jgi:hypothetical protein
VNAWAAILSAAVDGGAMKKKVSFKVSLGGIVSSICLFAMFLTGIMPLFVYALPAAAGTLMIIIVIEISRSWAFVTYISVGLLSLLITPDKEAAILFILFFGYYPIMKSLLEKLKSKLIEIVSKLAIFNCGIVAAYFLLIHVMGMAEVLENLGEYGEYGAYILLAVGNAIFVVYDIALTQLISSYMNWFRPKILRKLK